jgi:phosphoribosylformylglycinamidine cyclo-ligase
VLNDDIDAVVNINAWERPAIFKWLQDQGNVAEAELLRTFNCGIGMMVIVPADTAAAALTSLQASGEEAYLLGEIVAGSGQVQINQ